MLEQTSAISKKLREMVSRNTNKDMSAVLDGEMKEESEMDEVFDEMCLKLATSRELAPCTARVLLQAPMSRTGTVLWAA